MTISKLLKTIEEYTFTDVEGVSDPFRVTIDSESNRITIYHYDGVVSTSFSRFEEKNFKKCLIGLNEDSIAKRFAYERSEVKTYFRFDESLEAVKKLAFELEDFGLVERLGQLDDTKCYNCFIGSVLDEDTCGTFTDFWASNPAIFNYSPFVLHIMKRVWPAIVFELKKELSEGSENIPGESQ